MSAVAQRIAWRRDKRNPVLPPGPAGSFDSTSCMNPWAMRRGDEIRLYYAGGDGDGRRRICLATAPVGDLRDWTRHGPLFDVGAPGAFDEKWCVLPHVIRFAPARWHLYYTGRWSTGKGLSSFTGIGLAASDDGEAWRRHSDEPILPCSDADGAPDSVGVAGGSVLNVALPDRSSEWRFYYTGCPSMGDTVFLDQQKRICLAISTDGIAWEKRGALMERIDERDYENIAVAGPLVEQLPDGAFRMWYSAIGTRWGYYSICSAESDNGLAWRRGERCGDNLQLTPAGNGWEREMVEYPSVIEIDGRLHMFYCGNGYGATGIGLAAAEARP